MRLVRTRLSASIAPLERALAQRGKFGKGYANAELEKKRQAAVQWLREQSACGWICDKLMRRK